MKAAQESRTPGPRGIPTLWSWKIGLEASPFLLTTSAALLVAGTLKPRPGLRELFRQPGLIASMAILIGTTTGIALNLGHIWIARVQGFGLTFSFDSYLAIIMGTGELVAACWATLALAGAWRPESDWVDRSGRILGAFIVILWVTSELSL
jgi:hypothetical protein